MLAASKKGRLAQSLIIALGRVARLSGVGVIARMLSARDNIRISLTHYVEESQFEQFSGIVDLLARRRRIITPEEFFSYYRPEEPEPISGRLLLMTFDDGLLSSYHAAQRVLNPRGIKAIFFIPTMIFELETDEQMRQFAWENLYHKRRPIESLNPDVYRTMSLEQAQELHRQGHMIVPHTHSHLNISEIQTPDVAEREFAAPRRMIEHLFGTRADAFAFPVGTERVVCSYAYESLHKHYTYCFPALIGVNDSSTDRFFFFRDCIHPYYSLKHVSDIIEGVYDPYYRIKMKRLIRNVAVPAGEGA